MQTAIIGLLAETFVHPGCGRDTGVVDLPVAREAATDYPFIAGSSLKGALKDWARQQEYNELDSLFGMADRAGQLLVSDGRLLLLPVRSLTGNYKWVTCPHLLERLKRDMRRSGLSAEVELPRLAEMTALASGEGPLFLEERNFQITAAPEQAIIDLVAQVIPHQESRQRLADQLVILADADFAWFARYGLAVQARNVLEEETKKSKNLWYEETLPPDTLMYSVLGGREASVIQAMTGLVEQQPYLQAGGNLTVGQGWFALQPLSREASNG